MNSDWHLTAGKGLAWELSLSPFKLIQELDLSLRRRQADFAIIRMDPVADQPLPFHWPDLADGIQDLSLHNLLTYKGPQQPLLKWHLWEAAGFLVDYAKLEFRGDWDPLKQSAGAAAGTGEETETKDDDEKEKDEKWIAARDSFIQDFIESGKGRVFAVSTRRPRWLNPTEESWQEELKPGVYELGGFGLRIRLIIPREVELIPRNALWHMLSGVEERIEYGLKHCQLKDRELFGMFENQLERSYTKEGIIMPITVDDFRRDYRQQLLSEATPEEVSANITPEQLAGLNPEQRVAGLKPEERLAGLGLSEEEIREAVKMLGLDQESDSAESDKDS